jgi:hypothetical protein
MSKQFCLVRKRPDCKAVLRNEFLPQLFHSQSRFTSVDERHGPVADFIRDQKDQTRHAAFPGFAEFQFRNRVLIPRGNAPITKSEQSDVSLSRGNVLKALLDRAAGICRVFFHADNRMPEASQLLCDECSIFS